MLVGEFQPPTALDEVTLAVARAMSPCVQVLLVTRPGDPVAPLRRMAWLQDLAPWAGIVPLEVDDALNTLDAVADLRDLLATSTLLRPDAVIGPGRRDIAIARALALPYLPVDAGMTVPDSSALLADPLSHWEVLPAPARAHFVRRVVLLGPESSGKTTLARELADEYGTAWVPEFLRAYLDAKGTAPEPADLPRVVEGHVAHEAVLARRANRVLFCDTDPLMTAVYSRFYYGEVPQWLEDAAGARRADHYLLLNSDVEWVPDPQRDAPHAREVIVELCLDELEKRDLPFTVVSGDWEKRRARARAVVDALLGRRR